MVAFAENAQSEIDAGSNQKHMQADLEVSFVTCQVRQLLSSDSGGPL